MSWTRDLFNALQIQQQNVEIMPTSIVSHSLAADLLYTIELNFLINTGSYRKHTMRLQVNMESIMTVNNIVASFNFIHFSGILIKQVT